MQTEFNSQAGMEAMLAEACRTIRARGENTINEKFAGELVSCNFDDMSSTEAFDMPEWMKNEYGAIHGGATAAAFDNAMGVLAWFMDGGRNTQTMSLQISYMREGRIGQRLIVRSRVTKRGKNVMYLSADAWNEDAPGELTATADGVFHVSQERSEDYV